MSDDSDQSRGTVIVIIAVFLVFMLLGGLILLGGAVFLFRSTTMERDLAISAQAAETEPYSRTATDAAVQTAAQSVPDPPPPALVPEPPRVLAPSTTLALRIDAAGNLSLNGEQVDINDLPKVLQNELPDGSTEHSVTVMAHADSRFDDIAAILQSCREAGIRDLHIQVDEP